MVSQKFLYNCVQILKKRETSWTAKNQKREFFGRFKYQFANQAVIHLDLKNNLSKNRGGGSTSTLEWNKFRKKPFLWTGIKYPASVFTKSGKKSPLNSFIVMDPSSGYFQFWFKSAFNQATFLLFFKFIDFGLRKLSFPP